MTNKKIITNTLRADSLGLLRCGCSCRCENLTCSCPNGQPLTNANHSNTNSTNAGDSASKSSIKAK